MLHDGAVLIKGLLDEHGISYKTSQKSFITDCPKCDKKDKFYIYKETGRFVCFVCKETDGFQGAPEYGLSALLGLSVSRLKDILYGTGEIRSSLYLDINIKDFYDETEEIEEFEIIPTFEPPLNFKAIDSTSGFKGAEYLKSRGIPLDIACSYDLRYSPEIKRVIFPVKNNKKWIGWQARHIDRNLEFFNQKTNKTFSIPKIITMPGFKKDKALMFSERVTQKHAVLTEGPIDAIKAHLCGGNVCSMGKAVSDVQLGILKNSGIERLYLGLDPDAAGDIKRIVDAMSGYVEVYDMRPVGYKDIGEMSFDEVFDLFKNAPKLNGSSCLIYIKDFYAK